MDFKSKIKTIEWVKDKNASRMVDQLLIPYEYKLVDITTSDDMYDAIKTMIVRGAPAIGIAGAHGMALAALEIAKTTTDPQKFLQEPLKANIFRCLLNFHQVHLWKNQKEKGGFPLAEAHTCNREAQVLRLTFPDQPV